MYAKQILDPIFHQVLELCLKVIGIRPMASVLNTGPLEGI